MNKTAIEWADYTWNPVTGCLHGCPYCYARGIANRFGHGETEEEKFRPAFHPERLDEPKHRAPGSVFVCSMADLFGKWVPLAWIRDVFDAALSEPKHRYLFLTKNPRRYRDLHEIALLPSPKENVWFGATVTTPEELRKYRQFKAYQSFISLEPLHGPVRLVTLPIFNLPHAVIVGAETGNRKGKIVPKREWVQDIQAECNELDIPVFFKNSILALYPEFQNEDRLPWATESD